MHVSLHIVAFIDSIIPYYRKLTINEHTMFNEINANLAKIKGADKFLNLTYMILTRIFNIHVNIIDR